LSNLLPAVEVNPKGQPTATIIWLHGLGADGHDFEGIVPLLGLSEARFVFPHAPKRPVTVNGGVVMPAWYDIQSLGEEERGMEDEKGIQESARAIDALIKQEALRGIPASRVILAGFSQGGALALYVGNRYPEKLLGLMVLSAYEVLPGKKAESQRANGLTSILFCHGTFDPLVPVGEGREAYRNAMAPGRKAEWHEFPMAHEVNPEEVRVIGRWLKDRLGEAGSLQ